MIQKNFRIGEIVELYDNSLPLGIGGNGEFFKVLSISEGPKHVPALIVIGHLLKPSLEIKIINYQYIRKISSRRQAMVRALYNCDIESSE